MMMTNCFFFRRFLLHPSPSPPLFSHSFFSFRFRFLIPVIIDGFKYYIQKMSFSNDCWFHICTAIVGGWVCVNKTTSARHWFWLHIKLIWFYLIFSFRYLSRLFEVNVSWTTSRNMFGESHLTYTIRMCLTQ